MLLPSQYVFNKCSDLILSDTNLLVIRTYMIYVLYMVAIYNIIKQ